MLKYLRALRASGNERDKTLPYVDPLQAGRHPFQTYLLLLCFVSALPYLTGRASAEAVQDNLPYLLAVMWGVLLLFGSAIALLGTYWRGGYDVALTLERAGLAITGVDGLIYGVSILGGRDPMAPLFAITMLLGAVVIRIPLKRVPPSRRQRVGDCLSILGMVTILVGSVYLALSPAQNVLVGSAIITGFGLSCLRRSNDIASIFSRAKQVSPPRVLREGEG